MSPKILHTLKEIVGKENLLTSPEELYVYSYDALHYKRNLPEAAIIPSSTEQIAAIMHLANEERFGVVPRGSGTGLSGGTIPMNNCIVLLMNSWNTILEIDEENLTAWVQPGVITGQFQTVVETKGLFYPPDPGSSLICSIGGNVAENAGGLRGLKYGVTKNYVMGMEVILPGGEIAQLGGKNIKDVAGYNMKDVLVGSEGTLGIFTKILLRLVPKPETTRTLLASFATMNDAAKTVSDVIAGKIMPAAMEFLDATTIKAVNDYAKLGLDTTSGAMLFIETDGKTILVDEDIASIQKICFKNSATNVQIATDTLKSVRLRAARKAAYAALARLSPTLLSEDVAVPRSELAKMTEKIQAISKKNNITIGTFGHAGDGNLHPLTLTDENDNVHFRRAEKTVEEIYDAALSLGGTITGEHGVGLAKRNILAHAIGAPAIQMMNKLKQIFDPNNILNPGKIFSAKIRCEGPLPKNRDQIQQYDEKAWI